ncbi:3-ketosteroid-9-alpha-hydroxylase subunit A [Rhodococcus sp. D2-41]|uniref:Rieske-type oxygenase n=1 Tax=Speluncibacter jeojiensis TaxID=2710754 RepID=A0A9X4M5W5_9ACTN|nr:Rieske 2Fe-2S domain-containing protein [Rhodococcus sp. D2-41]MDG3011629.1 3-ketosteroid-9-alpha-hydroxylase subunit A [Rhodococcus sp. D2-41]MDG3015016.1 3-ketosteroid-9-alpha-hydroxylase subunit A [Corynebacteriales bacterium D3-21]
MTVDTSVDEEVRSIEVGADPTRYARGWHCIGLAQTFRDGKPHQVKIFGTDLVVWADSAGELNVLDAYCRHMGGNLAMGEVKGDDIACPFHDWRWGGNGRCAGIPYARRVPLRAKTRAWISMERNGLFFVWNDPQGNPPPEGVTIPEIDGFESGQWSEWTWNTYLVEGSNCREIVDNVVDMAHFFYVHFQMPEFFKNVFEGHIAAQHMRSSGRDDIQTGVQLNMPDAQTVSDAYYFGPSFMLDTVYTIAGGRKVETKLVNCHYPITQNSFLLQYGTIVKTVEGVTDEEASAMATMFTEGVETQFLQDVEIWKHKTRIENPLLTEEDGPVYQLRRWYQQFFVDVEDVAADMTKRFEFEVDTTRALQNWAAEVQENLTRSGSE